MSSEFRACPWCGHVVISDPRHVPLTIDVKDGASVSFVWHQNCVPEDELLRLMQQGMALPEHLAEEPVFAAYAALHMRTLIVHGEDALRRVFHVVRDWPDPTITLKGHGKKWGVKSFT